MTSDFRQVTTWVAIIYPLKFQLMQHHIGAHLLTTPDTNLTRPTEESTLEAALSSTDFSGLFTLDFFLDADFIVTEISNAVDKAIPKSTSVPSESNSVSDETAALIKERRRLRREYSQTKDPAVKTRINQLQKQITDDIRTET